MSRDDRLDVFVPQASRLKSYAKRAIVWLYSWGLLSPRTTQRLIDAWGLRLA